MSAAEIAGKLSEAQRDVKAIAHEGPRVETGPLQFGHDWPGVFIRGDNAMHYAMRLSIALDHGIDADPMNRAIIASLARLLASADTRAILERTDHAEK